jgi:hypothetical protein
MRQKENAKSAPLGILSTFILAFIILSMFMFGGRITAPGAGQAQVDRIQGVDLYISSQPVVDYQVVDSAKMVIYTNCQQLWRRPVRRAAKQQADGVIVSLDREYYWVIRYR